MAIDLLEKLRQMLLDMQHSGRLAYIEPGLYDDAREYVEKRKTDYYDLKNPLENRTGSLIIEEIGSVTETVQEIFSVRTRQVLDLAFQQAEGQYASKDEARKMLPEERVMYERIIYAIEECREALVYGEAAPFVGDGVAAADRTEEGEGLPEPRGAPAAPASRPARPPYALVHIRSDVESFMGMDGRTYVLKMGDIVTLPENNADVLCEHDIALNIRLNK